MTHHSCTLRIGSDLWRRIRAHHLAPGKRVEALSYAWARCERVMGSWVVLLSDSAPWFAFGPDCFENQSGGNVRLRPDVLNGMLVEFAASGYNCVINIHDHWFAEDGVFSSVDDADDLAFDRYLRTRFEPMLAASPEIGPPRTIYNVSLVLGRRGTGARLVGPRRAGHGFLDFRNGTVSSDRWQALPLGRTQSSGFAQSAVHSRHQAFLSASAQATLATLRVAIAGCGGLGSVLAESLGRLGVRHFHLIDDDRLDETNLNRWQGATPADVGQPKARLLHATLRRQFPDAQVAAVTRRLDHERSVSAMAGCDVLFGCLDNDAARWYLNHVAVHYMLPYFDAGVGITAGPPVELSTRCFTVLPGVTGCLECKTFQLIDRETVLAEFLSPQATTERRAAGYVIDQPGVPAPSAYMLNQRAAALLVTEFCNFIAGWRPTATVLHEHWHSGTAQRLDRGNWPEHPVADCPVCGPRWGQGRALDLPRHAPPVRIDPADLRIAPEYPPPLTL